MANQARRPRTAQLFAKKQKANYRHVVLACSCAYFVITSFRKQLLPWGPGVERLPIKYAAVDHSNTKLQDVQKIYAGDFRLKGPETALFDDDGNLYVLTEDGNLVQLQDFERDGSIINATATIVKDLGVGRPLGGRIVGDTLYVCDTLLGLIRVRDFRNPRSKVELVMSSVEGTPIRFANDVVEGPKTGRVYFTDSTDVAPDRLLHKSSWDTLYASKVDLMRGKSTGRLLVYDPETDEATVLATGLYFPNGIGIDDEESNLYFAETFGVNLLKYNLEKSALSVAVASSELPGYLDGVDCTGKYCFAVMPSSIVPIHKLVDLVPPFLSPTLRTILLVLPRWAAPRVKKFGGVLQYDTETGETQFLLDPTGKQVSMLTGVRVRGKKLYLGSLTNTFVAVYDLKN